MLFLYENNADRIGQKAENADRGRPAGAHLMEADSQGLIFEYSGQIINNDDGQSSPWGLGSLDAIAERLRKHFG